MATLPEQLSLRDLQRVKDAYGREAGSEVQQAAHQVVSDFQFQHALGIAQRSQDPGAMGEWLRAKRESQAADDAKRIVAGHASDRVAELSDDRTNNALTMATLTAVITGHPVGALASAAGYMAKQWAQDQGLVLGSKLLRDFAKNPGSGAFGTALASQAVQRLRKRVDDAVTALKGRAIAGARAAKQPPIGPVRFKQVTQQLQNAAADPGLTQQRIQRVAGAVSPGAPNAGKAYASTLQNAVMWLQSQAPKPPTQRPFSDTGGWEPSPKEMRAFSDKLSVVEDPLSVIDRIREGTLSSDHVAALRACFPRTYQQLCDAVLAAGYGPDPLQLDPAGRAQVAVLVGRAPDATLQQPPAPPLPAEGDQKGGGSKRAGSGQQKQFKLDPKRFADEETPAQRVAGNLAA